MDGGASVNYVTDDILAVGIVIYNPQVPPFTFQCLLIIKSLTSPVSKSRSHAYSETLFSSFKAFQISEAKASRLQEPVMLTGIGSPLNEGSGLPSVSYVEMKCPSPGVVPVYSKKERWQNDGQLSMDFSIERA